MKNDSGRANSFRIKASSGKSLQFACSSKTDLVEWLKVLQEQLENKAQDAAVSKTFSALILIGNYAFIRKVALAST